jgi:aminoglycoside phosphotransferase (APT) family kinase protein
VAGEEPLSDGLLGSVLRVGDTVRRRAGPWTDTVHALLGHLRRAGFDGAPAPLGTDEEGRDVVSYVPGRPAHPDLRRHAGSDAQLTDVARLLRRAHDALATFTPASDAVWQLEPGRPGQRPLRPGEIVCHNDVAPFNLIMDDGRPRALIDWDLAAPGPAILDVAHAVRRFVPLYPDSACAQLGWADGPPDRPARLRVFVEAYGLARSDRVRLLEMVRRRERSDHDLARSRAAAEGGAWLELWAYGGAFLRDEIAFLEANERALALALR